MKLRKRRESIIKGIFLGCACVAIVSVVLITIFIFIKGAPLFRNVSPLEFLFSTRWEPANEDNPGFGILSFIIGSFYVTFLSLLLGIPVGLMCAIFLAEFAKGRIAVILRRVLPTS